MRAGRSGTGRARKLRKTTTDAERLLWGRLRGEQLGWRFRRQHPIPPYIVDFACIAAKLIIEADGGQHNRPGDHHLRDRALRKGGWNVLRFWNNDIIGNMDGVLQTISAALGSPMPPPNPSPALRGRVREGA